MSTSENLQSSQMPATDPATDPATTQTKAPKVPLEMRAIITIFAADPELFDVVSPFINYVEGSVDWERLFGLGLSSGHKCVVDWAYIVWRNEIPAGSQPFEMIFNCDPHFRRAIAKALAVRWGVSK